VKFGGILVVVTLVLITNFVSLPASTIVSTLTLPALMPARPRTNIEIVCAAAAVVTYVECPKTGKIIVRPTGSKLPPRLMIDVN
jgi:hypothetical protein